jgi:hypothetical protein
MQTPAQIKKDIEKQLAETKREYQSVAIGALQGRPEAVIRIKELKPKIAELEESLSIAESAMRQAELDAAHEERDNREKFLIAEIERLNALFSRQEFLAERIQTLISELGTTYKKFQSISQEIEFDRERPDELQEIVRQKVSAFRGRQLQLGAMMAIAQLGEIAFHCDANNLAIKAMRENSLVSLLKTEKNRIIETLKDRVEVWKGLTEVEPA